MSTTTHVEAITINSDDGSTTTLRNDGDLVANLHNGTALGSGEQLGVVLIKLGIDDAIECPKVHEVALTYSQLGSPIDVLNLAIEQLATARDALARIQAGDNVDDRERNAFEIGVDAGALGIVQPGEKARTALERCRDQGD
ncbi:MAG: hypothetical protein ACR2KL_10810 [Nocardioidaceae bacterium]